MWYQCFREQKKWGGNKFALTQGEYFNLEVYEHLMSQYRAGPSHVEITFPSPKHPMNGCTYQQYKAVFHKIYKVQKMEKVLSLNWDDIWQMPFDNCAKHVKKQQPKYWKETYEEKVLHQFSPYAIVECYGNIEDQLWNDSHQGRYHQSMCANL